MLQHVPTTVEHIRAELGKVIVGQDEVVEQVLVALLAEGHALLEGVPGTAKTLLVKTLARIVGADFSRIQFTPDLMPSDITGTNVFNTATASFSLRRGPVFTDVLLADEINRTPPRTQASTRGGSNRWTYARSPSRTPSCTAARKFRARAWSRECRNTWSRSCGARASTRRSPTAQARAPRSHSSSARRRSRRCGAATSPRPTTCATSPARPCATASTFAPRPNSTARPPTPSSPTS